MRVILYVEQDGAGNWGMKNGTKRAMYLRFGVGLFVGLLLPCRGGGVGSRGGTTIVGGGGDGDSLGKERMCNEWRRA